MYVLDFFASCQCSTYNELKKELSAYKVTWTHGRSDFLELSVNISSIWTGTFDWNFIISAPVLKQGYIQNSGQFRLKSDIVLIQPTERKRFRMSLTFFYDNPLHIIRKLIDKVFIN